MVQFWTKSVENEDNDLNAADIFDPIIKRLFDVNEENQKNDDDADETKTTTDTNDDTTNNDNNNDDNTNTNDDDDEIQSKRPSLIWQSSWTRRYAVDSNKIPTLANNVCVLSDDVGYIDF